MANLRNFVEMRRSESEKQKYTGQVSTQLVRADIEEIRANFMKPEFWQKKWAIFRHGNAVCTLSIGSIDVEKMTVSMKIRSSDAEFSWEYSSFDVPVNHPEYSQKKFSIDIENSLLERIHDEEKDRLRQSMTYAKLYDEGLRIDAEIQKRAADWLDEKGETNEKIRETYIDAVCDAYWEDHERPEEEYLRSNAYKVMTNVYILALTWFENKKIFDDYMENRIPKSTRKNNEALLVWKMKKELSDGDFISRYLEHDIDD